MTFCSVTQSRSSVRTVSLPALDVPQALDVFKHVKALFWQCDGVSRSRLLNSTAAYALLVSMREKECAVLRRSSRQLCGAFVQPQQTSNRLFQARAGLRCGLFEEFVTRKKHLWDDCCLFRRGRALRFEGLQLVARDVAR